MFNLSLTVIPFSAEVFSRTPQGAYSQVSALEQITVENVSFAPRGFACKTLQQGEFTSPLSDNLKMKLR
jgi:hypothetical protein